MLNDIRADDFVRLHADAKRLQLDKSSDGKISIVGFHFIHKENGAIMGGSYMGRVELDMLLGEDFMNDCDLMITAQKAKEASK